MNRAVFFRCCLGAVCFLLFVFSGFGVACGNRGCLTEIAWSNRSVVEWERVMLINSMNDLQGRRSVSSAEPEQVKLFVGELNVAVSDGREISPELRLLKADSLADKLGLKPFGSLRVFDDVDLVDSNYVSRNVSLALHAFWAADWRNSVLLEVFREFVLPYKLAYELPDNWRDTLYKSHLALVEEQPIMADLDSLYAHHMVRSYYGLSSGDAMNALYPSEPNFSWLALSGEGDCVSRCRNVLYHLRAAGAPAAYDYVPCWGNRPAARHAYVGLAHRKRQLKNLLRNDNDPANLVNDLNAAAFTGRIHVFEKDDLPNGWEVQYEKTLPKMYCETWSAQPAMMALLEDAPLDELDLGLIKPNMQDVTSQYY